MYCYAIVSVVECEDKLKTTDYPLLDVCRSEEDSNEHFDKIIGHLSQKPDFDSYWDLKCGQEEQGRKKEVRRAMMSYSGPFPSRKRYTQTLIIERWNLNY